MTRVARWTLALYLVLAAPGCFSILASLRCGDQTLAGRPADQPHDCRELEEAAEEADDAILEAVRSGPADTSAFATVQLSGVVTDRGRPLSGAEVRLLQEDDVLLLARTAGDGRWRLEDIVEKSHCDDLSVEVRHPDGRASPRIRVECAARSVDWDFRPR